MKTQNLSIALIFVTSMAYAETQIKDTPEFIFTDTFEGGTSSSFWKSPTHATRGGTCPGSSKYDNSLVFHYLVGALQDPNSAWSEQRFDIPVNATQIEMSYDLYIPNNFTRSSGNHKNFVLWSGNYGKTASNISVSSEGWPADGGSTPSIYVGEDGNNYGHSTLVSRSVLNDNQLNDWIRVHVYLELAEYEGDYGYFEITKNDSVIIDSEMGDAVKENWGQPDVSTHIAYSSRGNFIDQGYLLGWANGGFDVDTELCIDNFTLKANSTIQETIDTESLKPIFDQPTIETN